MAIRSTTGKINTNFQELLCREFGVDYAVLADIFVKKIMWHKTLQNEFDNLSIAQRVCKDVANMLFGIPPHISVATNGVTNEKINQLIQEELYGRLKFKEIFPVHFAHFIGLGDGVLTAYRDPVDNRPAINYIPIYNVIPITYNNHSVSELVWFNLQKIGEDLYVVCTIEKLGSREVRLFQCNLMKLTMVDPGTPVWNRVIGQIPPIQEYDTETQVQYFSWFSSGLFNARWMDTPYHNGIIWPLWLIKQIELDYKMLIEEYKNSRKRIFVSPDIVKHGINMNTPTGQPQRVKQFDNDSTLFEVLDLTDEQFKEWQPTLRFQEFKAKLAFDLQFLGQQLGLGSEFYNIDNPKVEMTATQVVLSHRDAFNTINVMKHSIESCLKTIIYALINLWIEDGLLSEEDRPFGTAEISIDFDDGVFINKGAKVDEGLKLFQSQAIDQFTFLTMYCDYSEAEANEIIQRQFQMAQVQMQLEQQQMAMQQEAQGGGEVASNNPQKNARG